MHLKILKYLDLVIQIPQVRDFPIQHVKLKYKNHPSIVAIRNANNNCHFHFNEISVEEVYKEIRKLNPRKSAQGTDTPIRVFKEKAGIFADYIFRFFNESLKKIYISIHFKECKYNSSF